MLPSTLRAVPASPALDVQALVSRTYAIANLGRHAADGYDLCDTTHCQVVYRPAMAAEGPADAAARAVNATRGRVLTFEGRVIQALFHADCGGHTAAATSVWGGLTHPISSRSTTCSALGARPPPGLSTPRMAAWCAR